MESLDTSRVSLSTPASSPGPLAYELVFHMVNI